MKDFKRIDNERSAGADPDVTALLRAAYAAPPDEGYWTSLEQRVLARLNDSPVVAWWSVLAEWRTAGAVAATIALLLAGATVVREVTLERTASETVARAAIESGVPVDDATFSFGGRIRLPADAPERYLDPFDY
ncbi:MAG: hypothetical protein IPP90_01520 [Gemmatimonadaceae bacterium]|nr:hypothetical protein [Gemmatimonadaceae bacterium]